jgi:methionyl-tRNA formyltransferase
MLNGKKVQIFDVRKNLFRRFADVVGKVGEISSINDKSFSVTAQGGTIEVLRIRGEDGKKLSGGEFAIAQGLTNGIFFDV